MLVPLVLLIGLTQRQAEETVAREARHSAQSAARAGANVVSAEMRGLQDVVRAYAHRRLLQQSLHAHGQRRRIRRHLVELARARHGISATWSLEHDGRLMDIVPATPEIVGRDFSFRDYYRGVMRTRRSYLSEAFVIAARNRPLSVAAAELVPDPHGGAPGLLVAGYDLAAIQAFATRYANAEGIALTITDQRGALIAGPDGAVTRVTSIRGDELVEAALDGRSAFARRRDGDGRSVLAASAPVAGLGWTVTAELDEKTALAGVAELRWTQLMIGAPLAVALLMGLALLVRALRRRARAEEALRRSEERASGIIRTSPDGFVSIDERGRITAWNPAAETLFGWSQDDVLGRPLVDTILPAERAGAYSARLQRFMTTRRSALLGHRLELAALRRDGGELPIEVAISAIEQSNGVAMHAFIRDVSRRKRDEEELREAHAQAVEASRMKSEFVANMSHELRTPLNGVIGMNDLLLQTSLEPEQREYASMARRAGESLLSLISDILDFSKIEAGRLELDEVDFDVRELVDDACAIVAETAFAKGLELLAWVEPSVPERVRGDDLRLRQVLINLVGNAIKFTDAGEVVVRVSHAERRLRFEVSDTGIGIGSDQQERLWEPFTQADSSTTRNFGGTGLGLTISRKLVEAMDGAIGVDSEAGRGSTFHFEVPLTAAAAEGPDREESCETAQHLAGRRMLIVDDNATNRTILEAQLRAWGVEVTAVAGGHEALDVLRGARPPFELALLDYDMPGLDGLELAAAIRADRDIPPLLLALLTSSGSERTAAREADFRLYLTKPVRHETLRAGLARTLSQVPAAADTAQATAVPAAPQATVLVTEDNPVNQVVARATLEQLGFAVDIAADGEQAIAMSAGTDYVAVFMDCQMPRVDGYSATAAIRAREAGGDARIPIVAMTAHALKGDRERCLEAGMDDYLTKPLERAELDRVLDEWVRPGVAARAGAADAIAVDHATADGDAWLDPSVADRLRAEHSAETLRRVAALFAEEAPARLADLSDAARRGEPEPLWQAAHRLKSSCRIVGARGMERLCQEVEDQGREGRAEDCRVLVERLSAAYPPVATALQRRLD